MFMSATTEFPGERQYTDNINFDEKHHVHHTMIYAEEFHPGYKGSKRKSMMQVIQLRWRCVLIAVAVATLFYLIYFSVRFSHYGTSCSGPYWEESDLHHLAHYCNSLDRPVTGAEGVVPSSKYKLQSVHTVIRHGDRFHMHSLPNYENSKVSCIISNELKNSFPALSGYQRDMEVMVKAGGRKFGQTFNSYNLYPNSDSCTVAQLTPEGAAQHIRNGQFFRQAYQDKWQLLDEDNWKEVLLVRSTVRDRTFQSSLAFMYGLLPQFKIEEITMEEALNNSLCTANSGLPCSCSAIEDSIDIFSSNFQQRSPKVMNKPALRKAYESLADVLGTASNNLPPVTHIVDVFMVHYCHKLPLPNRNGQCVQPWVVRNVYDAADENGREQVETDTLKTIAGLKMQPMMYEIAHRMEVQASGKSPLKFILYAGHDSSINPLGLAFGFSSGEWCSYASRIVLELYTAVADDSQSYIRVLFDGVVVTKEVSFCKGHMSDSEYGLCPLQQFIDFVDGGNMKNLKEDSYAKACQKHISLR